MVSLLRRKSFTESPIKRWSYSAFSTWAECPAKYKYGRIDRLQPKDKSKALERGNRIHQLGEDFLNDKLQVVPKTFKCFEKELTQAKNIGYIAEDNWAIDKDGLPCEWKDWSRNWGMAKTDAHFLFEEERVLSIIDFKTGRVYPTHEKQAQVYAMFGECYYPGEFDTVEIEFWYLDQKSFGDSPFIYGIDEVHTLQEKWSGIVDGMMREKRFITRPSNNSCRFCDFRSDKILSDGSAGPCREWEDVR